MKFMRFLDSDIFIEKKSVKNWYGDKLQLEFYFSGKVNFGVCHGVCEKMYDNAAADDYMIGLESDDDGETRETKKVRVFNNNSVSFPSLSCWRKTAFGGLGDVSHVTPKLWRNNLWPDTVRYPAY